MAMINISDFVESWIGKGDEKQDTQRRPDIEPFFWPILKTTGILR